MSDAPVPTESTRVTITSGELRGKEHLVDTFAWFGIPYAAPPVGDLRWRAPRPALSWEGTFDAVEYGSLCFQPPNGSSGDIAPRTERMMGSEDCLSLNVYAPKSALNAAEPRPVYVLDTRRGQLKQAPRKLKRAPILPQAKMLSSSLPIIV